MRVRIEGYTVITKTLQTSYNMGVQANCKTKGVKTMAQKAHSLSHTKWMCKYHIVFTPKYRRKTALPLTSLMLRTKSIYDKIN